jgi:ketosteroid isomerase-like protein
MLTEAQTSIAPLSEEIRVKVPDSTGSETWLRTIGDALRYLQSDFDASFNGDVGWKHAAASLETAHKDASQTAHATKALIVFLQGVDRIVEPNPAVVGRFGRQL